MNVLLLGRKHDLEPSIVETLEAAGHRVQSPGSREEALVLIEQRVFDSVVLSYSLSKNTIDEFIEVLKRACPTCPIIAISENGEMYLKFQPARMLQWKQGAEALVSALSTIERRVCFDEQLRDQRRVTGRRRRYSDK